MSSIAEIRHHINVVQNTGKITRAMYLISSGKMKRAMRMHDQNLLYLQRLRTDIRYIVEHMGEKVRNPYYREHGKKAGYVVIAGDKGMCRDYNSELLKYAKTVISSEDHETKKLFTIGYIASDFFKKIGMEPDLSFVHMIHYPSLENARDLTATLCKLFRSKELDEVYIIYTIMEKLDQMKQVSLRILPVIKEDFSDAAVLRDYSGTLKFHPSVSGVLDALVNHYLVGLIYSALVQSYASVHFARMTAMDSATRNANDMLEQLRLELNRARQGVITQELFEIVSGSDAIRRRE